MTRRDYKRVTVAAESFECSRSETAPTCAWPADKEEKKNGEIKKK